MEFWFYIYLILGIVIVAGLWWIWTQMSDWWSSSSTISPSTSYLQEIFLYENVSYHLLRTYLIETCNELESATQTLELYTQNCAAILALWEKMLEKEHFLKFMDLQRKRWSLHLAFVENIGDEKSTDRKTLRITNRNIAQLHEDWWGLKFDGSGYMKSLNEMDTHILELVHTTYDEGQVVDILHNILYCQEAAENKIKAIF